MKKLSSILLSLTFIFTLSCTSSNNEEEIKKENNSIIKKTSTCSISGQHSFRGLSANNVLAYSANLVRNPDNSISATIVSSTKLSSDKQTLIAYDNSFINTTNNTIDIPTTGTYWFIPFDINYSPSKLVGGSSITYRCDCHDGEGDCNVEVTDDCQVRCQNESCTGHCCREEVEPQPARPAGSAIIVNTQRLILNGVVYE